MLVPRIKIKQEIWLERFALWQFENIQFSTQVIGVKHCYLKARTFCEVQEDDSIANIVWNHFHLLFIL